MRALAVTPGKPRSAYLLDVPEPGLEMGSLLVQTLAIGICGTDVEIVSGRYGWPPPGRERLIIGHESIGRVLDAPEGSNFASGDPSSEWSVVRIRCLAGTARSENGTCVATACTPNVASRSATAMAPNVSA